MAKHLVSFRAVKSQGPFNLPKGAAAVTSDHDGPGRAFGTVQGTETRRSSHQAVGYYSPFFSIQPRVKCVSYYPAYPDVDDTRGLMYVR